MLRLGDFKYALRLMLTRPGFTLLTVFVLAGGFGIGLYTFGALNTIVYGELPIADGGSIVRIGVGRWPDFQPLDAYEIAQIRSQATGLQSIGAFRSTRALIGDATSALNARTLEADWGIFDFAATQPLHGRGFVRQDSAPGAEPVAVLGNDLWLSAFGGDPAVIGTFVRIRGTSTRIIGVMPAGFRFPQSTELWVPLGQQVLNPPGPSGDTLNAYARVRRDVPIAAIEAELTTIVQRARADDSASDRPALETVSVLSFPAASFGAFGDVVFGVLNVLALSILLLAAVNVGNLLLARTNRRIREVGVRIALGAPRAHLIAQVVLENLLLCVLGGAIAVWLAARGLAATNGFMRDLLDINMPFWWIWELDRDVLTVGALCLALTVTIVSILPAISVSRADPNLLLREGGRGGGLATGRISRALVTVQVALISALMLVGSVATVIAGRMASFDFGMDIDDVLMLNVRASADSPADGSDPGAVYARLLEAVRAAPEIEAAMVLHDAGILRFSVGGADYATPDDYPGAWRIVMSPADPAIGPTLVGGRAFDARDTATSQPVALVSASLAQAWWPGESPLGRTIEVSDRNGAMQPRTVIGIMAPVTWDPVGMTSVGTMGVYLPASQVVLPETRIIARHRGNEARARGAMYEAVVRTDTSLVPGQITPYTEAIDLITRFGRTIIQLFAGCGLFAIVLAITGIYGMSSNGVVLRRHEIGLRRALGASDGNVLGIFVVQGVRQLAVGLLFSLLLSVVALAVVSLGFALDAATLTLIGAVVVLVVSSTVLLSIYLSVRGVLRLEPGSVLRFA